jgi:hypothetical protein
MRRLSLVPVGGTPAAMTARMQKDGAVFRRIITEAKISSD